MLLFFLISCATPFLKVKSDALVQPAPTLMTTAILHTTAEDEEVSLFEVVDRKDLDEVGFHLVSQSTTVLDKQGFQVFVDNAQARTISNIIDDQDMDVAKKAISMVAGLWISKDGSEVEINNNIILLEGYRKSLVEKLNTEKENEHFLFISARVNMIPEFLILTTPSLLLDYVILNEAGLVVFRGRGIGKGKSSFLFPNKKDGLIIPVLEKPKLKISSSTRPLYFK